MKKIVSLALALIMLLSLSGCCRHVWNEATCLEPMTCAECGKTKGGLAEHTPGNWQITKDPVGGQAGSMDLLCAVCETSLESNEYTLGNICTATGFTLTADEMYSRFFRILKDIRPGLNCMKMPGSFNVTVSVDETLLGTFMFVADEEENDLQGDSAEVSPFGIRLIEMLSYGDVTVNGETVSADQLQLEIIQALIMTCDPSVTADEAWKLVDDFMNSGEPYAIIPVGDVEYLFFLSAFGTTILSVFITPAA